MLSQQTDYLQIDIVAYESIRKISERTTPDNKKLTVTTTEGKKVKSTSLSGKPGSRKNSNKKSEGTILLPIPSNISDTNAVDYQSSNLNSIAGAAVGGVMDIMQSPEGAESFRDGLTRLGQTGQSTLDNLKNAAGGVEGIRGFATRFLASKAVGLAGVNITPNQILARSEGQIMNPNMELLFNGPGLRSFRFQFKLTPRGETEADEIKKIIRTFKEHMAPKVSNAGTFLKTPDVFELRYRKGADPHPFLHRFKQCFLKEINVNYTGEGTYATYDEGTPVSMIMDLSFQEIEPIYDIDYQGYTGDGPPGPDSAVGGVGY